MNTLPLLVRREYWEHRGGFLWVPLWISAAILVISLGAIVTAEVFRAHANIHIDGITLAQLQGQVDAGGLADAARGLDVFQLAFASFVCIGLAIATFFYLIGALYDDRRDRSVLFWKSLPVSDTATVISKALAALVLMPLIAVVVATLGYGLSLVVVAGWAALHGINALPVLWAAHPAKVFLTLIAVLPISALWAVPTVGWLLFWSAFARSKPIIWAVLLPLLALAALHWIGFIGGISLASQLHLGTILARLTLSAIPGSWLLLGHDAWMPGGVAERMAANPFEQGLDVGHAYALLATPNLWLGVIAGATLIAAAIWLRGRRIETNV